MNSGPAKPATDAKQPPSTRSEPEPILTVERKTPGVSIEMALLPENYQPSEHDVLCGRGGVCRNWPGNLAYRRLIEERLDEYAVATSKNPKRKILDEIIGEVRRRSGVGGFIKKDDDTGRWYEVGNFLAREKTSQCFRDALHEQYASSAQSKYKRRKREQKGESSETKIDSTTRGSHGLKQQGQRRFESGGDDEKVRCIARYSTLSELLVTALL